MSATLTTTNDTLRTEALASSGRQLRRVGAVAGLTAAVATVGVAAAADGIGVPIQVGGKSIPLIGFGQLTLFFTAIGVVIASGLACRSRHPRRTFVSTTLVLTALSFVPDAFADAQTATKVTLVLTHVVAASIVIPALASRLAD